MTTLLHYLLWEGLNDYRTKFITLYIDTNFGKDRSNIDFIWDYIDN